MPAVRHPDGPRVLAVLVADIHLSHSPPPFRASEPNWYAAMARQLQQLNNLADNYKCPVVCAGDVFDRWIERAELVNFAMEHIHNWYAVPGQHDLPHHNYLDIKKTPYWTLVAAGRIKNLIPGSPERITLDSGHKLVLYGYPWDHMPSPLKTKYDDEAVNLAVIHSYVWKSGHAFPGCPERRHVSNWLERLKGFDAAVFGDNHKGFYYYRPEAIPIFNCGTFFRRVSDELNYRPQVGLLLNGYNSVSCFVEPVELNTDADKVVVGLNLEEEQSKLIDMSGVVEELNKSADTPISFEEALVRALDGEDPEVRVMVGESLEEGRRERN